MKNNQNESGITLIALIITIIVLVILAAVSISAVYNSNIVNYAVNGATNYASEATRENEILDQTASIIQNAVDRISNITGGNSGEDPNPGGDDGEEPVTPPDEPDPGINFGDLTEEEMNAMVGKYVDYTPVSGSFSANGTYNGNSTRSFSTNTEAQWQILFVNDDTLALIAENPTNTNFYLQGANGYNNGVKLLNDACAVMYSNSSLGAVARSIDIEDIEAVSSYDKTTFSGYGQEYSPLNKYYPNIFKDELTGSVDERYGSLLGLSDQTDWVTGSTQATILGGKWTYYTYTMTTSYMNSTYVNIFTNSNTYWLASRCVDFYGNIATFRTFFVSGSTVDARILYSSNTSSLGGSYAIRPIVEIDLSKVNVGLTGDGSATTPYSIEAK